MLAMTSLCSLTITHVGHTAQLWQHLQPLVQLSQLRLDCSRASSEDTDAQKAMLHALH